MSHSPSSAPSGASTLPTGEEVVQNLPWRWNTQGRVFLVGGLGFMFDAWDVTLNGVMIPLLSKEWDLEPGQAAWIGTANLIGMALGAFVWGTIADRIGRRKAFTATLLIFSLFTLAGALTGDIVWFAVFRFIAGFGLGGCIPVDYALVGEFTPRKHRGRVLTAMDGWWPIGAAACGFLSAWLVATWGHWQLPLLAMVLPALLVFFVRLFVPESPLFLIQQGREKEARAVIDDMVHRVGLPPQEYVLPPVPAPKPLTLGSLGEQVAMLWRYSSRITFVAWSLFFTIMLVYYIALQWLPKFLIDAGYEQSRAFITTGGMAAVGLLGVIVAAWLVEHTGRKWLLGVTAIASSFLMAWLAAMLDVPTAVLPLVLAFGFVVQLAIPVLYTYVSELYPTELRGSGFGWASAVSRIAAGVGPLIFVTWMVPAIGLAWSFVVTGCMVVVAVVLMAFMAPETTGKELEVTEA
ncbi:MFS transporter [Micrococcus terreus]|uniref:MFS transporter, putative metabolite:H+ symporter n=1 Tax=Micrococcus terreus TaxID=574650 RepID=A0A1I7MML9_9MICC|nr:MFS transporter [Micrococcus terreus]WDS96227.1 putative niacin/nicotinamide transporter [Micrococcus sp.]SFV23174.1 MFS transporter, putative metabolite:H+ symporter [Micrococcus terreus]